MDRPKRATRRTADHSSTRGFCMCCGVPWPCPTIRRELLTPPLRGQPAGWVRDQPTPGATKMQKG